MRIIGISNLEDIDPEDEPRTFRAGRFGDRLKVILAGVTVNIVIAFVLFFVVIAGQGHIADGPSTTIDTVVAGSAAASAGFRPGDRIVEANGKPIDNWTRLKNVIVTHADDPTTFVVLRHGVRVELTATPKTDNGKGFLGVGPSTRYRSVGVFEAVPESFRTMGDVTAGMFHVMANRFSPSGVSTSTKSFTAPAPKVGSTADLSRPRSLIGIIDIGSQIVGGNLWGILLLLGEISLILALFNLLPILPFDGGHAAVVLYEWVASKVKHRQFAPTTASSSRSAWCCCSRCSSWRFRQWSSTFASWVSSAMQRRVTRQIHVGSVAVGGDAPVSVQSMTTTKTADVDGTLAQIYALAGAGCDIVRCTCNDEPAAEGLARIVPRSPVPIVADIHFQYKLALAAMEAGVQALRLNPGNIRKPEHVKLVAREAKDRGVPIRIGVNAGSLDPDIAEQHGGATPEALVASAQRARVLRRGRLRRREDLGEVVERAGDDRRLPAAVGDGRHTAASRRHRGGSVARRPGEVDRRHRHAAVRGDRRHHPLLAHRRPGGGSEGRASAARSVGSARAQGSRPDRVPVVWAGRGRRDPRRAKRRTRSRSARSRCRSR